jgi:integrase
MAMGMGKMALEKLKPAQINAATKRGYLGDGGGLYLKVALGGSKSWVFRFKKAGRLREMGLGGYPDVSLTQARAKARGYREDRRDYEDPIEARRAKRAAERLASANSVTFKHCAERYVKANEAGWRNDKHRNQWASSLETYIYPVLGGLPVAAIDTDLVMRVIEPIWSEKTETASRVRGRIETVLDWAAAWGYRKGENPARWRGHIDKLLPKKSKVIVVKHHAAVPLEEITQLMARLHEQEIVVARALEFTILTAVRTGELIKAQWSEIDLDARLWTAPAEHTKGNRDRRTPLSDAAVAVLRRLDNLRGYSEFVFPGSRRGRGISESAMLRLLKQLAPGATVHGARSTFRDWASERTAHDRDAVEIALSHTVGDATERAYRRGDLLEKRRGLMQDWGKYCGGNL